MSREGLHRIRTQPPGPQPCTAPGLQGRVRTVPWPGWGGAAVIHSVPASTSPSFSGAILQGFTEARPHFPSGGFLFWPNNDSCRDPVPAGCSCCQGLDFLHTERREVKAPGVVLLAFPGHNPTLRCGLWVPLDSVIPSGTDHTHKHLLLARLCQGTQNTEIHEMRVE